MLITFHDIENNEVITTLDKINCVVIVSPLSGNQNAKNTISMSGIIAIVKDEEARRIKQIMKNFYKNVEEKV